MSCFSNFSYAALNTELSEYAQKKSALNDKIVQVREEYLSQRKDLKKSYAKKLRAFDSLDKEGRVDLCLRKRQDSNKLVEVYCAEREVLVDQIRTAKDAMRQTRIDRAKAGDKEWNTSQMAQ